MMTSGGDSSVVERRASDRKIADPWFDSRTGNASLSPWQRHYTPISHLNQAVYRLWWPSLVKDLHKNPKKGCSALVWLDRRRVPDSCKHTK